ncbi:hypothetical protein QAD02_006597 [Eretmocerus hayati]|uniref:Uncharacterized protein n=1 Tax=Eretmocerus hayati TaxID=131215 RepID=A0ACC2N5L7_9HYME|nr:hypothetical protein QAD02_006597 [Eretmocerus hayati]
MDSKMVQVTICALTIILLGSYDQCKGIDLTFLTRVPNLTRVTSADGPVIGERVTKIDEKFSYSRFLGIPYARDPSGSRRFKPPEAIQKWNEPLVAVVKPPKCKQIDPKSKKPIGVENCLSINVYTPQINFSNKESHPVMVWIHGGAFKNGDSDFIPFPTDMLVSEKIVVVTFNYRLGVFGFLNLHHPDALGNAGLKDQILALKWVKRNIRSFGGDPNKITIVGHTAGAVAVDLHLVSDMSKGLFHQSISMSGSPLCLYWGFQNIMEAKSNAKELGEKLNLPSSNKDGLLQGLLNADANEIIQKTAELESVIPFRPTLELSEIAGDQEKFITECIYKKFQQGRFFKGPHITGYSSSDAYSFCRSNSIMCGRLVLEAILENEPYLKNMSVSALEAGPETLWRLASDLLFAFGVDAKQRLLNAHNGPHPVYYYRHPRHSFHLMHSLNHFYNASSNNSTSTLSGGSHRMRRTGIGKSSAFESLPIRKLVRMWANFVKYGHPTPLGEADQFIGVAWPSDTSENGAHLEMNWKLKVVNHRRINPEVQTLFTNNFIETKSHDDCAKHENMLWGTHATRNPAVEMNDTIPSKILHKVVVEIDKLKSQVPPVAQKLVQKTKDILNNVRDRVIEGEENIQKYAENKVKQTLNATKNYITEKVDDFIKDEAEKADETIIKTAEKWREDGKSVVHKLGHILADKTRRIVNSVFQSQNLSENSSPQNFVGLMKYLAEDVLDNAIEDGEMALDQTGDQFIDDSINTGEQTAEGTVDLMVKVAGDVINGSLGSQFGNWKSAGRDFVKGSIEIGEDTGEGLMNTANDVVENGKNGIANIAVDAVDRFSDDVMNYTVKMAESFVSGNIQDVTYEPGNGSG